MRPYPLYQNGNEPLRLAVATAPAVEPVTLAEAKAQLRVDISADDTYIAGLIAVARERCELVARRTFINTTYDLYLDWFPPSGLIVLPRPPLSSVTGLWYTDQAGTETQFDSANYLVDAVGEPGQLMLRSTKAWPNVILADLNGVRVRFVAGYGAAATAVPARYKQAILLLVGHWYENREATVVAQGLTVQPLPMAVDDLLRIDRGGWF